MSFRDFLSFPICKLFITVPKHTFLGLIKKSFPEPHVELNINRPPAFLFYFPGEKRKNTSMNSLNLLWTFVGFQKLDWISLETIFECWLSKGPRCLVTNKKYLSYLLQLSTTKHGVCQKKLTNLSTLTPTVKDMILNFVENLWWWYNRLFRVGCDYPTFSNFEILNTI